MSGFLGAVTDALLGSGFLTLGGMVFTDWSLPERVSHGGQRQLTIHKHPGGARTIDDMGDDPHDVTFSAYFFGLGVATAMRAQLEAMRSDPQPVDLTWSDQALTVKIADATYDEEHAGRRIRFTVRCVVIPDIQDEGDDYGTADGASDATEGDMGDGETPDTPAAAKDGGRASITRASGNASLIPTPPVPPAVPPPVPTYSSLLSSAGQG